MHFIVLGALNRIVNVERHEISAALASFAYFFCLLCGYYILRPVRDEMGISGGLSNLPWLFTGTFIVMFAVVPVFGWASARLPRATLLPAVYGFFIANLLIFYGLMTHGADIRLVAPAFFIWVSVFNLFVVSVFWSFMVDIYSEPQAQRLFGFIAVTLALLPALSAAGFVVLGLYPLLAVVVVFQVVRRAGEYAITKPARELLFTVVGREQKYKAKNFVDTVVFRGADAASGWLYAAAKGLGAGVSALSFIAAPLALGWMVLGWHLGKKQQAMLKTD